MELMVYFLLFCGVAGVGYMFRDKFHRRESEYDYGNRLDQMREDGRIRKFIEDEAQRMFEKHKRSCIDNSAWAWDVRLPVYYIYDYYTAKFSGICIIALIRARFNELIKENENN